MAITPPLNVNFVLEWLSLINTPLSEFLSLPLFCNKLRENSEWNCVGDWRKGAELWEKAKGRSLVIIGNSQVSTFKQGNQVRGVLIVSFMFENLLHEIYVELNAHALPGS